MPSKLTTVIFIERAIATHGQTYDYTKVTYVGIMNKITIICSKHGDFQQTPNDHLAGYGCKLCGCKRTQDAFMKKHGVTSAFALASSLEKRKQTWLDKYGVDNPSKDPIFLEKRKQTWLDKYGVDNPLKSDEVINKRVATLNANHGVCHNSQIPNVHANQQRKRSKPFTLPSGIVVYIQGYEHIVIQQLLDDGYDEVDIMLKDRPSIQYFWSSDDGYGDDNWHTYHPDIVLPREHKMIEVKSQWTYDGKGTRPSLLAQNIAKHNGAIQQGWDHIFVII